jgi:dTDP-4-amino-4,6-dideoxygalactose transaminase
MSEVEAAMGLVNLSEVDGFIAINERNYRAYCEQLAAVPGLCCIAYPTAESNNFQYMIVEVADDCALSRDQIVAVLNAENVFARRYFWPACHRMSPYRELQPEAGRALPRTEFLAERVFSLPTGSSIGPAEVADICTILRRICDPAFGPVDLPATGADDVFPRRRSA